MFVSLVSISKTVDVSNFGIDERTVSHPNCSSPTNIEDPKHAWSMNSFLSQWWWRITNVLHQTQLSFLGIGFRPPFREMQKTIDIEHACPEVFILKSNIDGDSIKRFAHRWHSLSAEFLQFHINGHTPIGKFIRVIKVQLFNIEHHLQKDELTNDFDRGSRSYIVQGLDFIFVVLKNMAIGTERRECSFSRRRRRTADLILGSHSSLYVRSIAWRNSREYTRLFRW